MAKLRLKYDFADGPYLFAFQGSEIPPMGVTPTAKVLNIGTSSYPVKSASSGNLVDIRGYYTNTSGDARNIYDRLYLYGSARGASGIHKRHVQSRYRQRRTHQPQLCGHGRRLGMFRARRCTDHHSPYPRCCLMATGWHIRRHTGSDIWRWRFVRPGQHDQSCLLQRQSRRRRHKSNVLR